MMAALDAILACRLRGSRLYGKPLQLLDVQRELTVLESCGRYLEASPAVRRICLAVSDEPESEAFRAIARKHDWAYVTGDAHDVLGRLLHAATTLGSDQVLRVTSECPFVAHEHIPGVLAEHLARGAHYSSIQDLPEGAGFEIIRADALSASHRRGTARHRSELVTSYIFEHQHEFTLYRPDAEAALCRPDVRITIDHPEDLIFCRHVHAALGGHERLIPLPEIVTFWDTHPDLRAAVEAIGIDWGTGRLWK
jgi:spore coat polysaccharide biosynthesis protein SpsF